MRELVEDTGYFSKVCLCRVTLVLTVSRNKGRFPHSGTGTWGELKPSLTKGNLCPACGQVRGGQRSLPVSVDS